MRTQSELPAGPTDSDQSEPTATSGDSNPSAQSRLGGLYDRYREMAGDVAWSGASDLLQIFANAVSFGLLGKILAPAGYGSFIGFYAIVGPLGSLAWAGLMLFVLQQILRERQEHNLVAKLAFTMLVSVGVPAVAVALVIAGFVVSGVSFAALVTLAVVELLIAPLVMLTAAMRQAIIGFAAGARLKMVLLTVRTTAIVVLWAVGQLTILNLALVWFVSVGLLAFVVVAGWPSLVGTRPGFLRPNRRQLSDLAALSIPMAAGNVQTDGDKAVLNAFNMQAVAGYYGAAFRIVLLAQLPIQTLNTALFQRFLSVDENVRSQHLKRTIKLSATSTVLSVLVGIALYFTAPLLTVVLDEYEQSVEMIRALLLFLPLVAISHAPLNGLLGLGAPRLRGAILISSAALALTLYIVLIPTREWRGALIGTVVSEAFLLIAGWASLITLQRRADRKLDARVLGLTTDPSSQAEHHPQEATTHANSDDRDSDL